MSWTDPAARKDRTRPIVWWLVNLRLYLQDRCWLEGWLRQSKGDGLRRE